MADTKLVEQLQEEGITVEEDLLSEVVHLVTELHIDNEDLVNEWQAYCISSKNKQVDEAKIVRSSFNQFAKKLRLSKSVKIAKKSKPRSQFGVHSVASMQPLMENLSTPNKPNRSNSHSHSRTPCNPRTISSSNNAAPTKQDNEALFNELMSMETPIKSAHSSKMRGTPMTQMTPSMASMMQSPALSASQPTSQLHSPAPSSNSNSNAAQYKSRKSGDVMDAYNAHLPKQSRIDASRVRLSLVVPEEHGVQYPFKVQSLTADDTKTSESEDAKMYRFMYEDVHAAQTAIAERMTFIGEQLLANITDNSDDKMDTDQQNTSDITTYSALDEPSQRECLFHGRIINDGDNAGSEKITAGNMLLESSSGQRVKLDISAIAQCALFPGQTIAVRGINSSGKEIIASVLYTAAGIATKQLTQSAHRLQIRDGDGHGDEELTVLIAAGPFTAKTSVDFEGSPLHELAKVALIKRPSVVILCGPFTDGDNDEVKNGRLSCTLQALFEHLLTGFLRFLVVENDFAGTVVAMPSTKDAHYLSAFPQPKYPTTRALAQFVSDGRLRLVGNPCELRINNVSFAVCAENFLFDCARMGLQRGAKDRLLRIMACALEQQSFYPQLPSNPKVRMGLSRARNLFMHQHADVFVLPSNLKQFAKRYEGTNTVCVNTGFATRGNSNGSYAMVSVLRSNDYRVEDYSKLTRVDVLRI